MLINQRQILGVPIQSINITTSVTEWGSIVEIGNTPLTANIIITLPTCVGNIGKSILFKRIDNTVFTITIQAFSGQNVEITTNDLNTQFGGIEVTCVSATKSEQTSNNNISGTSLPVAEFGEVTTITDNATTTSTAFVDVPNSSFTLPSAGVWEITYDIYSANSTNLSTFNRFILTDNLNNVVPNSQSSMSGVGSSIYYNTTQTVRITTTGATTYKMRWCVFSASTATIYNGTLNSAGVNSKISWKKISGFVPVSGQSVDYLYARYTNNQVISAGNTDLNGFVTNVGNVANASGVFTLIANKTYNLEARVYTGASTGGTTNGYFIYKWVDAVTNNPLDINGGSAISDWGGATSSTWNTQNNATLIYTPTTNQTVKLRITTLNGFANITVVSGNGANAETSVTITQLGSSATTQFAGATQTIDGTSGFIPAPLSTQQFRVLKGNGAWGVLSDGQTNFLAQTSTITTSIFTTPQAGLYQVQIIGSVGTAGSRNVTAQNIIHTEASIIRTHAVGAGINTSATNNFSTITQVFQCDAGTNILYTNTMTGTTGDYNVRVLVTKLN